MPDWRSTPGGEPAAEMADHEAGEAEPAPPRPADHRSVADGHDLPGGVDPAQSPVGHGPGAGGDLGLGQGGGQQGAAGSGGSYGQGAYGDSARRSAARTTQYDGTDREAPVAGAAKRDGEDGR